MEVSKEDIVKDMRRIAEEKGYDDQLGMTDEELFSFYNAQDEIYEDIPNGPDAEIIKKENELSEVLSDIEYTETAIQNAPNYLLKSELQSDLRDLRIKEQRLLNEIKGLQRQDEDDIRRI